MVSFVIVRSHFNISVHTYDGAGIYYVQFCAPHMS